MFLHYKDMPTPKLSLNCVRAGTGADIARISDRVNHPRDELYFVHVAGQAPWISQYFHVTFPRASQQYNNLVWVRAGQMVLSYHRPRSAQVLQ